jgi:hypothetical protein
MTPTKRETYFTNSDYAASDVKRNSPDNLFTPLRIPGSVKNESAVKSKSNI